MIALFLLLIIVAIVLGIVGVVAKGLLYLLIIGIVVFLGALLLGALGCGDGPAGSRPGSLGSVPGGCGCRRSVRGAVGRELIEGAGLVRAEGTSLARRALPCPAAITVQWTGFFVSYGLSGEPLSGAVGEA
jgi:hypothetical protein